MQVSIRELKANPARAIGAIRPGVPVQITSHRKVVAELVLPVSSPSLKASLPWTNLKRNGAATASLQSITP